ncbi:DNA cytosine methyltransferase [Brevibacterium litoralis]|uniref:DNA cytosine methyltransferase n=1 Tax=Brevibacterium litoralis TaxID=3138935 RepID=UPI0032EBB6E4
MTRDTLRVVEICAGAGGQALGLELAGFEHALAIELDENAAATLKYNRPDWNVAIGDVAEVPEPGQPAEDHHVWNPDDYVGVNLLAGGVPCPPFSIAGKQLGANDERDLFAWAVELVGRMKPRAVLLENVRGLSMPRFAAYRQWVKDRLAELGYWSDWRLLEAKDYGVPQLRPRFILVALPDDDARYFEWPEKTPLAGGVGEALYAMMASEGWPGADAWREGAKGIAPTIVGGSKKHGGADLGPTRAKKAWAALGVDAKGIADEPPTVDTPRAYVPRLTTDMVARIQGWGPTSEYDWTFTGRKTTRYRQIGNAFPPPVARAVGASIRDALLHVGREKNLDAVVEEVEHEPLYLALKNAPRPLTAKQLIKTSGEKIDTREFEQRIGLLARDFNISSTGDGDDRTFALGSFKGFVGQKNHYRAEVFEEVRSKVS